MQAECAICNGKADEMFKRIEVWSNDRWRVTMSTYKEVKGFCYLEPKRHIQYITELDGKEASEFGSQLALLSSAVKSATGAKLVYVYIYGDHVPHLHVHLAPHKDGDIFVDDVIRKEVKIDETLMQADEIFPLSKAIRNGLT